MLGTAFPPWPAFSVEEGDAVRRVLLSNRVNYWTGEEGRQFEREFAAWTGVDHAVAVTNGTVALDLAWHAIGIRPGDEVVVTPRTFIASASSIINAGGVPVFADVDADSQDITPETVLPVLSDRTRAILAVHFAGWPCKMDGFRALASDRGIALVEDCAQAHGARYHGRSVGALGDIAAWSFCQDKIMTIGGEGGMVTADREDLWRRTWSYKDHGKSWDAVYNREHPPGYRWLHEEFGTNWRLTEMQAVLGRIQLKKMPQWHRARRRNAEAIAATAAATKVFRAPLPPPEIEHAWYKLYAFVRPENLRTGWTRDRIIAAIEERGVPCYSGSCSEVYLERAFDGTPFRPPSRLPVAKELGETSVMFLVHPTLTDNEIGRTCEAIAEVARIATR